MKGVTKRKLNFFKYTNKLIRLEPSSRFSSYRITSMAPFKRTALTLYVRSEGCSFAPRVTLLRRGVVLPPSLLFNMEG